MSRQGSLDHEQLLELVQLIYSAALDEREWPTFLSRLPGLFGATGALMLHHDMVSQGHVSWASALDPDGLAQYQAYYHQVDPWVSCENARRLALPGTVLPDEALLSRSELQRTEFWGFVEDQGMSRLMVSTILRDEREFCGLSVYRPSAGASFDEHSRRFMTALLPHLTQALQIQTRLAAASVQNAPSAEVVDGLPTPVLFVDARSRVISLNRAATSLLLAKDGIGISRGELVAATSGARRGLRAAIASAAALAHGALPSAPQHVALPRPEGKPRVAKVVPLVGRSLHAPEGVVAYVFVLDPERGASSPSEDLLREVFRLTPTEVRVARGLAGGQTPTEVADSLGLTRNTARWYLKQLFAKVGVSTQAQLAVVLGRLSGPGDAGGSEAT